MSERDPTIPRRIAEAKTAHNRLDYLLGGEPNITQLHDEITTVLGALEARHYQKLGYLAAGLAEMQVNSIRAAEAAGHTAESIRITEITLIYGLLSAALGLRDEVTNYVLAYNHRLTSDGKPKSPTLEAFRAEALQRDVRNFVMSKTDDAMSALNVMLATSQKLKDEAPPAESAREEAQRNDRHDANNLRTILLAQMHFLSRVPTRADMLPFLNEARDTATATAEAKGDLKQASEVAIIHAAITTALGLGEHTSKARHVDRHAAPHGPTQER